MRDRLSPLSNLSSQSSSRSFPLVSSTESTKKETPKQTAASGNFNGRSITIAPVPTASLLERTKAAKERHIARIAAGRKNEVPFFSAGKKNSDQKRITLPEKSDFTVRGQSLKLQKQSFEESLNHQPTSSPITDSQITSFSKEVTPGQHTSNKRSASEEIAWQDVVHPLIKDYFLDKKLWIKREKAAIAAQAEEAKALQAYEREGLIQTPLGPLKNNKVVDPLRKSERSELEDWTSVDFGEEQSAVANPIPDLPNKPTPDALAIEIDRRAINKAMNDGSAILKDLKSTTQSMRDELAADAITDTMDNMIESLQITAHEEAKKTMPEEIKLRSPSIEQHLAEDKLPSPTATEIATSMGPNSKTNDVIDREDDESPFVRKDSFSQTTSEKSLDSVSNFDEDDDDSISDEDTLLTELEGLPYKKNERTSIWRNVSAREAKEQVVAEKRAEDAKRPPGKIESSFTE